MDRSLPPTANKYLQRIWDEKNQIHHQKKLKSAKSRIDHKAPFRYSHCTKNPKREQILEGKKHLDRYTEIERENRILLEKMSQILQNRSKSLSRITSNPIPKNSNRGRFSSKLEESSKLSKNLSNHILFYSQLKTENEKEKVLNRIHLISGKNNQRNSVEMKKKQQKALVYLKTLTINNKKLDIEIYRSKNKIIILAYDLCEMYKLSVTIEEAKKIMKDKKSYKDLLQKLNYEDGNLTLVE